MNYQKLYKEIVTILRRDYAGKDIMGDRFSPRYYTQAIGQAWNDSRLDDLLFLQYVNQMLACIGDRHLQLSLLPSEEYTPSSPGFYTRRYEDSLYVTAVTGESRLSVGDRITAINGGSPMKHKAIIQKDFFRGSSPEREDWNGLLKMAEYIDVTHKDGTEERIFLQKHPLAPPELTAAFEILDENIALLRPAAFDGSWDAEAFMDEHAEALQNCSALILDLRNGRGTEEDGIYPLLPLLCREETYISDLLDDRAVVLNTRLNCLLKAAALRSVPGAEHFITQLARKVDTGFGEESFEIGGFLEAMAPETVVVLTDTWCRDSAETLALAAKRAGLHIIGRPTLGTIHTLAPVSYELDERWILSWPTALTPEAAGENSPYPDGGVEPDEYIPWTPEECNRDLLLEAARTYISKRK